MEEQRPTIRQRIARWINGGKIEQEVTVKVDDSPGWTSLTGRPHDYDQAEIQELYADTLKAWRKNPIAWRIISIITNYVVGDRVEVSSNNKGLNKFIDRFWFHPKNYMELRLPTICDELSRAGDIFVLLFRNEQDGMSYFRMITKDRITKIETAENDWETELAYYEQSDVGDPKKWYGIDHPDAENQVAIMLHYAINRPAGALMGESDLTTMIPWLLRYSRMLEDRVRLHWAVRAFLWIVTVPSNKIKSKQEQYKSPPDAGSIIVKDESETWEVVTPILRGADAAPDLMAVRNMIDAGSGFPPHWRGEPESNLATAMAMQAPTERHLIRRQRYFVHILQDILYHAYMRSKELGKVRNLTTNDYSKLFIVSAPDISRSDNELLARSSKDITQSFYSLATLLNVNKPYTRHAIRLAFKFAGEPISEDEIDEIMNAPTTPPGQEENRPTENKEE